MKKILFLAFFIAPILSFSQRGIKGSVTISAANTIVNEYTILTANAAQNATSITVSDNTLDSNATRFNTPLAAGDLIFIYQAQGATLNGVLSGGIGIPDDGTWGAVTSPGTYGNAGNYEFAEVASVSGGTIINLTCGLKNPYTASGKVQVIRVPRYQNLTINSGASITSYNWSGSTGGIVVIEVNGTTTINGSINVSGKGFRGGLLDPNANYNPHYSTILDVDGAMKGESIAGYQADLTPFGGMYCMAAPANGGGGGNAHNGGGGGGANGGDPNLWDGKGNPSLSTPGWAAAWDLESASFSTHTSSGGGRGGYSFSNSNQNALTLGPGQAAWGGDNRKVHGGLGGRPMDYSTGRIFFGGGGGAGDQNEGYGSAGANGGGIVFIQSHGTVGGTGSIVTNGNNAANTLTPTPGITSCTGKDGAGGGGGGGCVMINSNGAITGISITANGGNGGNQNQTCGAFATAGDAYGPGGGGGGGYIGISNGSITRTSNGGNNGTTGATALSEFLPNGATKGGSGTNNASISNFYIDVPIDTINICSGNTATFTATITGTLPSGAGIVWYSSAFGTSSVGTGTTFTTPTLTSSATYYVGICPGGFYRIPVYVNVGTSPVVNTSAIVINDATCGNSNGSITGITATGATGYTWNGNSSAQPNISNIAAGSYTLVALGNAGCNTTVGPFVVNTTGGATINTSSMVIASTTCGNINGSITGITASGTAPLSYSWNGGSAQATPDISGLSSGNYTLQVSDGAGCITSAGPFTINPSTNPVIDDSGITISSANCGSNNGSITGISVSNGLPAYSFTWNGNASAGINLTNIAGGNYTLVVTDAAGCTATSGPYTVSSIGGATIDDSNIILTATTCGLPNGSISGIIVSGGAAPLVIDYNGNNSPGVDVSNLSAGTYNLTITDNLGCVSAAGPYTIASSADPVASATFTDPTCFGFTNGTATANGSGGNAPYSFQWIGGPSNSINTNLGAGTYSVIVIDADGCDDTTSVTLTEPAEIIGSISGNTSICEGQTTTLTATGSTSYVWSTSETTSVISVSPTSTSDFYVFVSDGTCSDSVGITINVTPLPVASISGNSILCEGNSVTLTASGGTSYLWNTGSTNSSITVNPSTNTSYSVTASNSCGNSSDTIQIVVVSNPTADAGADVTISLGSSTSLNGSGGVNYSWSPSTGLSDPSIANPVANPGSTTTYILTVTDANGCSSSDDVIVTVDVNFVVFVPDAFSPNGDGSNDILFVRGSGIAEFEFNLYDRWGQKIFTSTDLNTGWDGMYKGEALNNAVFIYTLSGKFLDGSAIDQKGNVTLYR